jgi:DNA integrity scanning protein DisA with diadenylate cyclase activity
VKDGNLINFKTLDALRRFTEVEKLSNIKFGELTNRVRIANKMIIIPEMTLENSALTLKVEGTNGFDGKMNFLIQMQLRELLGNKKTIRSKRLDDFIKEKNNQEKVWIPLRMNGYPENIKFSIDTKKIGDDVKLNIKNDWKKQSEDIKSLFNNKKKNKKEETEYEFIWEEEPDTNRSFSQLDRSFNESL